VTNSFATRFIPVGERRDETRVGEPVVGEEPVSSDAAMEIVDGDVVAWLCEAPVDVSHGLLDVRAKVAVFADLATAWQDDLEGRRASVTRTSWSSPPTASRTHATDTGRPE
jgi:hypothetical protein